MKIAVVAPTRHPISEPYAGGLEAFCGILVDQLRHRGHRVDLFAAAGSTGHDPRFEFPPVRWAGHEAQETDHTYPPGYELAVDHNQRRLRHHLETNDYDVVHNNSLHPELLRSRTLPLVTTLHCPPVAPMARHLADAPGLVTAVSRVTATEWGVPGAIIVPNGVDDTIWRPGPGGDNAVWFGRIVPEKAPHLAIEACRRADVGLTLIGRCGDPGYARREIVPRLDDSVRWLGPMAHAQLADVVGRSRVAVVTPMWDEPFGLVSIEAMACGTPVAGFARGGLAEILAGSPFPPVSPGDVAGLAGAIRRAGEVDRGDVAAYARSTFGLSRQVDRYLELYQAVAQRKVAS